VPQGTEHVSVPHTLSQQAAVEIAARYVSAYGPSGIGEDWVDVIPLSGGRVALVVSHCLHTSATTGGLRAVVRALTALDIPPDELLAQLDGVVGRRFSGNASRATCLCVVYDPVTRWCTMARAGHPPPVVVLPDGTVETIDVPVGPALGLRSPPFEAIDIQLPEGSVLALYTDSLVGQQAENIDWRRLAVRTSSLEELCDDLLSGVDHDPPGKDVALLLARTRVVDTNHTAAWELPPDLESVASARKRASRTLARWGLDEEVLTTEIIVSELVTNAIRHASGPIELRLIRHQDTLSCMVSDGSDIFPQLHRARADEEGGRGLLMVAQLCQRWGTRSTASGKVVWTTQAIAVTVDQEQPGSSP
jgi:anti-sigma regulatory factor (Ser/Thr protein kinase)